jgi:hypothetical protein
MRCLFDQGKPLIRIRDLPVSEWERLKDHPGLQGASLPAAGAARILVAEEEGEIIAFWITLQVVHLEPMWITPRHRGSFLVKRLWTAIKALLATCSVPAAYCFADRVEVADYLTRLGLHELPYRVFLFEAPPCPHLSSPPESPLEVSSSGIG